MGIGILPVTSSELQVLLAKHGSMTAWIAAVFAQWQAVSSYGQLSAASAMVWHWSAQEGMRVRICVMLRQV